MGRQQAKPFTGKEIAWEAYANLAWKGDSMHSLAELAASLAAWSDPQKGLTHRSVLRDFVSAMLGCFNITPAVLPAPILKSILDIISGIFAGT